MGIFPNVRKKIRFLYVCTKVKLLQTPPKQQNGGRPNSWQRISS